MMHLELAQLPGQTEITVYVWREQDVLKQIKEQTVKMVGAQKGSQAWCRAGIAQYLVPDPHEQAPVEQGGRVKTAGPTTQAGEEV